MKRGAVGKKLSHEFGHLLYLRNNYPAYVKYIIDQGSNYQAGGHGPGDPNGIAADNAEKGVFPIY